MIPNARSGHTIQLTAKARQSLCRFCSKPCSLPKAVAAGIPAFTARHFATR